MNASLTHHVTFVASVSWCQNMSSLMSQRNGWALSAQFIDHTLGAYVEVIASLESSMYDINCWSVCSSAAKVTGHFGNIFKRYLTLIVYFSIWLQYQVVQIDEKLGNENCEIITLIQGRTIMGRQLEREGGGVRFRKDREDHPSKISFIFPHYSSSLIPFSQREASMRLWRERKRVRRARHLLHVLCNSTN